MSSPTSLHPLARSQTFDCPASSKPWIQPSAAQLSPIHSTPTTNSYKMADLSGRKVFKVFNQDFIVDERYTVTKELGQGAYGIVW